MAGNIKGITIEFRGDTSKLDKALRQIKTDARGIESDLKDVNKALKFNPGNVELLGQKQLLLKKRIEMTKERLDAFKKAQASMDASGVDKTSAEYQKVRREIIQAESQLRTFNKELLRVEAALTPLGQAGAKMDAFGKKATAAGRSLRYVSMVAAGLAGAIGGAALKAGQYADDLNTLSKQYGDSTRNLQIYGKAAELVDVPLETLEKSHAKLTKSMSTAAKSGTSSAAKAFDALGVSVTDSNGKLRDNNKVYSEVIKKLGQMKNETERNALAMDIFGKSAAELNPLIEDGGETYRKFAELMERNNLIIPQKTLDNANAFKDQLDIIKAVGAQAFQKVGAAIAEALLPILEKATDAFSKFAGKIANMDGKLLAIIGGIAAFVATLSPVLLVVGGVASGLGKLASNVAYLGKLVPGAGKAMRGLFMVLRANPILLVAGALIGLSAAIYKSGASVEDIQGLIQNFVAKIPQIVDTIVNVFSGIVDALPTILPALIQGFVTLIAGIAAALPTMIPELTKAAVQLFMALVQAIPAINLALIEALPQIVLAFKEGLADALPVIWESIKATAISAWDGLVNIASNVFGKVKDAMLRPFETARALIKAAIDKIKAILSGTKLSLPHIKLPHFTVTGGKSPFGIGGKGSMPKFSVDWYKNGAIMRAPTIFGVNGDKLLGGGEAGSEGIIPLDPFWNKMDAMQAAIVNGVQNAIVQAMASSMGSLAPVMAGAMSEAMEGVGFYLDKKAFARAVAPEINDRNNELMIRADRKRGRL